jgi:phage regulator Rha-like protein
MSCNTESTVTTIASNFGLKDRLVSVGYGQKKTPVYEMTRDGFMILVMGFTAQL